MRKPIEPNLRRPARHPKPLPSSFGFPFYREWSFLWGCATGTSIGCLPAEASRLPAPVREQPRDLTEEQECSQITFLCDSLFLAESFKICCKLNEQFAEVCHYASGFKVTDQPPVYVIGHIIELKFSEQSAAGVRVEDASNVESFRAIERSGLTYCAHFHSHPGYGARATLPSALDRRFQERLERGGACAVGGVFARDGYLRFFAGENRTFRIVVRGNNIVRCGPHLFQLTQVE
jgi:hypothetical protein